MNPVILTVDDPEPPMGTVVAQSGLFPMTWDSEFWVGLLGMKLTLKPGITYQVLRWGWTK